MREQCRCARVWTLGKVWEDLSLGVAAVGLGGTISLTKTLPQSNSNDQHIAHSVEPFFPVFFVHSS